MIDNNDSLEEKEGKNCEKVEKVEKGKLKKIMGILNNVLVAILAIIIIFFVYFMFQGIRNNEVPTILSHQLYIVRSNSMSPTFETGSLLFVRILDPELIEEGDIITYKRTQEALPTTHRVVEVLSEQGELQFVTRGDANNVNDPNPLDANDLVGRVSWYVPYLGFALGFASTRQGIFVLMVVPASIIIIGQVWGLIKTAKEEKKKRLSESKGTVDVLTKGE